MKTILQAIRHLNPSYQELLYVIGVNTGLFWSDVDFEQDLIAHRMRQAF